MSELTDNKLVLWYVISDHDWSNPYSFNSYDKALSTIESGVRGYLGDYHKTDEIAESIIEKLKESKDCNFIPIKVGKTEIILMKIFIDEHTPMYKVLKECEEKVADEETKSKICELFA